LQHIRSRDIGEHRATANIIDPARVLARIVNIGLHHRVPPHSAAWRTAQRSTHIYCGAMA
jgi:hypothetical protein